MRTAPAVILSLALVPLVAAAVKPTSTPIRAVFADGVDFVTAPTKIDDCATAGTDNSGALGAGRYRVCAFDEDIWLTSSSPASASGYRISPGRCEDFRLYASTTFYCYSAGGTGDAQIAAY